MVPNPPVEVVPNPPGVLVPKAPPLPKIDEPLEPENTGVVGLLNGNDDEEVELGVTVENGWEKAPGLEPGKLEGPFLPFK